MTFAKQQGVNVDLSQITPVGAGISEPVIAKPRSMEEAKENMRVEFRIVKVDAESITAVRILISSRAISPKSLAWDMTAAKDIGSIMDCSYHRSFGSVKPAATTAISPKPLAQEIAEGFDVGFTNDVPTPLLRRRQTLRPTSEMSAYVERSACWLCSGVGWLDR